MNAANFGLFTLTIRDDDCRQLGDTSMAALYDGHEEKSNERI